MPVKGRYWLVYVVATYNGDSDEEWRNGQMGTLRACMQYRGYE